MLPRNQNNGADQQSRAKNNDADVGARCHGIASVDLAPQDFGNLSDFSNKLGEFLGNNRLDAIGQRPVRIVVHFQPALYFPPRRPVAKIMTAAPLLWLVLRRRSRVELVIHEADPPVRWRPDYILLRAAFVLANDMRFHTEAERREFGRAYGRFELRRR